MASVQSQAWGLGLSTGCIPAHTSAPSTFPCPPSEIPGARLGPADAAGGSWPQCGPCRQAALCSPTVHALTCCSACPKWGQGPPCLPQPLQPLTMLTGPRAARVAQEGSAGCLGCSVCRLPPSKPPASAGER